MINSRFQQVLQIENRGLRSAKRAVNGAVGGPSQLHAGIKKGPRLGPISGPASEERTPLHGGCLPIAGPRQLINNPPPMGVVIP